MAADTRCSIEGSVFYHAPKIFRIGNSLFGTAGDGMMCLVMIEWLQTNGRSKHALYKHWTENTDRSACWLIELRSPGELYVWDGWGVPEKILDKRYAIGSGQMAALAAYDRGASLEESVKAGTNLDQYSGAPIHVEMLKVVSQKGRRKRG